MKLLKPKSEEAVIRGIGCWLGFYVGTREESLFNAFSALLG